MKEINVAELLKDCPRNMELDCTIFNNVTLQCVDNRGIWIGYIDSENNIRVIHLTCYGGVKIKNIETKCVIFPKGKTTWEGFTPPCQFKDGDIIYIRDEYSDATFTYVAILKQIEKGGHIYSHCFYNYEDDEFSTDDYLYDDYSIRFATEEEKQKLFDAIKANGYKWSPETRTLEKLIQPKFKVGDRIRHKENGNILKIVDIDMSDSTYCCGLDYVWVADQDNYELVPNKFDITTLKPFDKVLVRNHEKSEWQPNFFNTYCKEIKKFKLIGICTPACGNIEYFVDYCIPYEGNEHLLGKVDDCAEYFKNWK